MLGEEICTIVNSDVPRFKLMKRSQRLRIASRQIKELAEREEIRVPAAVLEGVQNEVFGLGQGTELEDLLVVRSDRFIHENCKPIR